MNWLISIHSYLWRNSVRRWREQPLSLLSKLAVSGLLGILGAVVILGTQHLGKELDSRMQDAEILTVMISESFPRESATGSLFEELEEVKDGWAQFGEEVDSFYQAGAYAELASGQRIPVWAIKNLERNQFVDDFYLLDPNGIEGSQVQFQIADNWSQAIVNRPNSKIARVMYNRPILVGGMERLSPVLYQGYGKTTIIQAKSIEDIEKIHRIADTFAEVEGRRGIVQSNLQILRDLERIRGIQAQALLGVSLGSSIVLGLVFGSLAWMEFREERYLLSLLRSFGVGRLSLLGHAVTENVLLAVAGVALGFVALHFSVMNLDVTSLNMAWLLNTRDLIGDEGRLLLIGAACGGLFSCVPIAVALRKQLGLVLN